MQHKSNPNGSDEEPFLKSLREEYESEKNPFTPWLAYQWAASQAPRRPLPAWVQEYLDEASRRLMTIVNRAAGGEKIADLNRELATALDFGAFSSRGRGSALTAFM